LALRPGAAGLTWVNGGGAAAAFPFGYRTEGRPVMPTIDILVLVLVCGGALAFMAEMIWYSMDRNKLPRDRR
jgi:hypothetical protein